MYSVKICLDKLVKNNFMSVITSHGLNFLLKYDARAIFSDQFFSKEK